MSARHFSEGSPSPPKMEQNVHQLLHQPDVPVGNTGDLLSGAVTTLSEPPRPDFNSTEFHERHSPCSPGDRAQLQAPPARRPRLGAPSGRYTSPASGKSGRNSNKLREYRLSPFSCNEQQEIRILAPFSGR